MSVLSVVREVCAVIGVNPPTSLFSPVVQPRTQLELLSLANEMAQRIAYDVREWRHLKEICTFTGDGVLDRFPLPANFKRMLLTAQVYPSESPTQALSFIPDADQWLVRRLSNQTASWGEFTLIGDEMLIWPIVPLNMKRTFVYLDKNCVKLNAGGFGDRFVNDLDEYRLDERLLKLGMIWQWKANKGSPYAEDMGTYSDALVTVAGNDTPAPIIIGDGRWQRYDAGYVQPPR